MFLCAVGFGRNVGLGKPSLGLQLPVCYTDRNTNEESGGLFGYHLLVRGTQGMNWASCYLTVSRERERTQASVLHSAQLALSSLL